MARRTARITLLGVIALAAVSCVVPIADLGGATSGASGINDAGVVVGSSDLPTAPGEWTVGHAYKRMPDNSVVDLGTLPGHDNSSATRINAGGTVIGLSWGRHDPPNPPPPELAARAVMWDASGQITDLGSLGANTEALALNEHGVIVGESGGRAFVFDPAVGHMQALPDLPGGEWSRANAINDLGEVVGYQYVGSIITAVRWNVDDGTVEDISGLFEDRFVPYAINDRGTIGGMMADGSPGSTAPQAALVLAGTTETIIVGAGDWSAVYALNEADTAAVIRIIDPAAFRWQQATGLVDLAPGQVAHVLDVNEAGSLVGVSNDQAAFFGVLPTP